MERLLYPYHDQNIRLVTSSRTKSELAGHFNISVEQDGHKQWLVAQGEKKFDEVRNNGIIVPYYCEGLPYSVGVTSAKATAVKLTLDSREGQKNHKHAVTDSGLVVENMVLGKPNAHPGGIETGVEELSDFYYQVRGKEIRSETALVVFDGSIEHVYLYGLNLGKINPDLNREKLNQYMTDNSATAGGVDVLGGWNCGIFLPDEIIKWDVQELKDSRMNNIGGGLIFDPVNNQSFKGLANGIIR